MCDNRRNTLSRTGSANIGTAPQDNLRTIRTRVERVCCNCDAFRPVVSQLQEPKSQVVLTLLLTQIQSVLTLLLAQPVLMLLLAQAPPVLTLLLAQAVLTLLLAWRIAS